MNFFFLRLVHSTTTLHNTLTMSDESDARKPEKTGVIGALQHQFDCQQQSISTDASINKHTPAIAGFDCNLFDWQCQSSRNVKIKRADDYRPFDKTPDVSPRKHHQSRQSIRFESGWSQHILPWLTFPCYCLFKVSNCRLKTICDLRHEYTADASFFIICIVHYCCIDVTGYEYE